MTALLKTFLLEKMTIPKFGVLLLNFGTFN
jgi:hypothetical protein